MQNFWEHLMICLHLNCHMHSSSSVLVASIKLEAEHKFDMAVMFYILQKYY
jgi:hypothetical protein